MRRVCGASPVTLLDSGDALLHLVVTHLTCQPRKMSTSTSLETFTKTIKFQAEYMIVITSDNEQLRNQVCSDFFARRPHHTTG